MASEKMQIYQRIKLDVERNTARHGAECECDRCTCDRIALHDFTVRHGVPRR